ncbi:MAG: hypothetical protein ACK5LX_01140 [Oscillospiraceae bacterium]
MATDKQRLMISVDDDMFDDIEKYRYEHKYSTRSAAILSLLEDGIAVLKQQVAEKEKAPTAEDAADAIETIMRFSYDRYPSDDEVERFGNILPIVLKGIKDDE